MSTSLRGEILNDYPSVDRALYKSIFSFLGGHFNGWLQTIVVQGYKTLGRYFS